MGDADRGERPSFGLVPFCEGLVEGRDILPDFFYGFRGVDRPGRVHGGVVRDVLPDARQVHEDWDSECFQRGFIPYARVQQNLRGAYGTCGEDNFFVGYCC